MAVLDELRREIMNIREIYGRKCNSMLLRVSGEFAAHYERSGFSNVNLVAAVAGLSDAQYVRIMNGKSLPKDPNELELARRRLEDHFGFVQIDETLVNDNKRELAFECVLSRLGRPQELLGIPLQHLAKRTERVPPPDHGVFTSNAEYDSWLQHLMSSEQLSESEAVVIGKFVTARELLEGFSKRLLANAESMIEEGEKHNCSDTKAERLADHLRSIGIAHACFKVCGNDWESLQKSLLAKAKMLPRRSADSLAIVEKILGQWGLTTEQFLAPWSSPGFLAMESPVVRPLALHVLAAFQYK